jgi:hypothetical protein
MEKWRRKSNHGSYCNLPCIWYWQATYHWYLLPVELLNSAQQRWKEFQWIRPFSISPHRCDRSTATKRHITSIQQCHSRFLTLLLARRLFCFS